MLKEDMYDMRMADDGVISARRHFVSFGSNMVKDLRSKMAKRLTLSENEYYFKTQEFLF